jgi:hypothetical protein
MTNKERLMDRFWEKVNKKCKDDVATIVMDCIYQRSTADETMDRIAKRCSIVYKLTEKEKSKCPHCGGDV